MGVENLSSDVAPALPSLNALRAFEVAGRHLNIRRASEEMRVTAGAVSQQIRKLEAELGVALFLRQADGLAFTAQGRAYHRQIAAIFEDLRAATAALRPATGRVTISVTPTVASKWLIPRLPEFAALHPDIDVRVLATERVMNLRAEPVDLAIRQSAGSFGSGVRAEALFRQELIAVCAPELLGEQAPPLSDAKIARLPLLHDANDFWGEFLSGEPDAAGVTARGQHLGATGLCLDAALAGQGAALASRFLVARELADGRLVQISPRTMQGPETYFLLRRRDAPHSRAIDALHAWLSAQRDG